MNAFEEVRARRAALVAKAEVEREAIARRVDAWRPVLTGVNRGLKALGVVRRFAPVIGAGLGLGLASIVATRGGILGKLIQGGLAAWRFGRSVRELGSARRG